MARDPVAIAGAAGARRGGSVDGARASDRPLGELLQRGSVRSTDRSAVEALHLARAPAARLRAVRVLPPDVSLRIVVGLRRLCGAERVAAPQAPRATGRVVLLLRGSLFDRPLRDRGLAPG